MGRLSGLVGKKKLPAALDLRQGRFSSCSVPSCINLTGGYFSGHNDWNNNAVIDFLKRWRKERLVHIFSNTERCPVMPF